jgi:phage portal protein BeeE
MQKVTWVFRCIDAIAGNQARLPVILRKGNDQRGEQTKDNESLLEIFNSKSNDGENSFAFRYRISAQLLMSTRGVFTMWAIMAKKLRRARRFIPHRPLAISAVIRSSI